MSNKTVVRIDELSLLIRGVRRSMEMFEGELIVEFKDGIIRMSDIATGEVCEMKLSDNVKVRGEQNEEIYE